MLMIKKNKKLLGIIAALVTILGTIIPLDINAYFHPEAALLVVGGSISHALLVNNKEIFARRISEGAVFFGWLGLLIAWIYIAYSGFSGFRPKELGVSVAYSMHPLFYGYIIKFFSRAFES